MLDMMLDTYTIKLFHEGIFHHVKCFFADFNASILKSVFIVYMGSLLHSVIILYDNLQQNSTTYVQMRSVGSNALRNIITFVVNK